MALSDPSRLRDQPMSPPPPGITSTFADPKSRASVVYITTEIYLPLILIFATLHFYAKFTIMEKIKWDDGEFNSHLYCFIRLFMA